MDRQLSDTRQKRTLQECPLYPLVKTRVFETRYHWQGQTDGDHEHTAELYFFALSAVRPNNPVANEQNVTIYHLQQNTSKSRSGRPESPSQDCSSHPGKKHTQNQQGNSTENAKNGERKAKNGAD